MSTVKFGEPGASEENKIGPHKWMHDRGRLEVGSLHAFTNQGPVSVTFRPGTPILKLNAKESYYSSHFVLLTQECIERLQI